MIEKPSLGQFLRKFKNDDACLDHIFSIRFPKGAYCENCKKVTVFYKIEGRPAYQCSCNYQISPLAGTIFEKTTTPLQYWFYAIFVMTMTRSGISAKQLQRELGVTYKTAWRMMKQIRMLMANVDTTLLGGVVEIDETFVGGKGKNRAYKPNFNEIPKEIVMGMVQRNGKAYFKHIPNTGKWTLLQQVKEHVDPTTHVMTDEYGAYVNLPKFGFAHDSVKHSASEYVTAGMVHTNTVEGFWLILERGVYGVYRVVSKKYLQAYVDEYAWRYNNRDNAGRMFDMLLGQIAEVKIVRSL